MNRFHNGLHTSRSMPSKHPMATTCSDKVAVCMAVPAFTILLFGLWWAGIL